MTDDHAKRLECIRLAAKLRGKVRCIDDPGQLVRLAQLIEHYLDTGALAEEVSVAIDASLEASRDGLMSDAEHMLSRLESTVAAIRATNDDVEVMN